jgi:molybdate transport system substrate-binding protein
LISLTMASTEHFKGLGTYVLVPTQTYPAVRQCAVVLKTDRKAEAHAFLAWMLSPEVQNKLPGFGLAPVR